MQKLNIISFDDISTEFEQELLAQAFLMLVNGLERSWVGAGELIQFSKNAFVFEPTNDVKNFLSA